jgi:uncharacterized membrane protein
LDVMSGEEESGETVEEGLAVSNRLFLLLIVGFALVFVGIAVILVVAIFYGSGSVSGGVVIFIGPFPIVIGAGPDVTLIVIFSIVLAVLSAVVFLVMNRRLRKFGG